MKQIPLAKPDFDRRELEAVRRVLESGRVVQGPEVEAFEDAVARTHQARHCIAVSSGTAALHVCYLALGIGPGDALFVPGFAWPSAANMAMVAAARPVFVDVLPGTYNIDPANLRLQIERCLEHRWGKPRAVVPVHQFGLAADMTKVLRVAEEYDLQVVEDAACALGATYQGRPVGTFGTLGIFSFHPRKAVTTGEGGAIVTNDPELAGRCRLWRNHGQHLRDGKRDFTVAGMNYRMTELQAAIGRVQLGKLPAMLNKRRELAARYRQKLSGCPRLLLPTPSTEHTWQTFMVVLDDDLDRGQLVDKLAACGVQAGPGSVAAHCTTVCRDRFGYKPDDLRQSLRLHEYGLALPLFSSMERPQVELCTDVLRANLPTAVHTP